ncbi:MAG: hypothetical protein JSW58_13855 [Candidatus Latescibacterota bacterium]|nr:MAG: hypothetical protein JSW58_13855 [Candidatus Latescibacterota bacterium]
MADSVKNITIHTKKYYRVVLESVDAKRETPETFAIKLSVRTRTPLPRAKQVVKELPFTLKSNLSAAQANRLKSVIEDIGGKARLESHLVTPGADDVDRPPDLRSGVSEATETIVCPACGWEEKGDAKHCSLCLRRFRDPGRQGTTLRDKLPEANPLEADDVGDDNRWQTFLELCRRYQLPILLGVICLLVLILIIK